MLIPMGFALINLDHVYVSYAIVLISSIICMLFTAVFNIYAQAYLQKSTPNHLMGKVSSFVTMIVMCAFPIGQSLYGFLFEVLHDQPYIIFFGASILSLLVSIKTKQALYNLKEEA